MQLEASDKLATGFDGFVHFRAPADLMPAVHAHARRRGLTSASWLRMVIFDALERGGTPVDPDTGTREAA